MLKNKVKQEFKFDRKQTMIQLNAEKKISPRKYVKLLNYINGRIDEYSHYRSELISRLEQIDCMLGGYESKEEHDNREQRRRDSVKQNDGNEIPTAKLNLTLDRLNDALTAIMGILFPQHSFYRAVAEPNEMQKAHALVKIMNEEAKRFKHYSEISKIVMHSLKYNISGGIVEWAELYGRTFEQDGDIPGVSVDSSNGNVNFEGNKVEAIDVFNSGWDMSVSIEDVARDGEYFWQVKRDSLYSLYKRYHIDETLYGPKEFKETIKNLVSDMSDIRENSLMSESYDFTKEFDYFSAFGTSCRYHTRETFIYNGRNNNTTDPKMDWSAWANGTSDSTHQRAFGTAEVVEIFVKLNPREFGLSKKDSIETWYFEIVNDVYIISASKIGDNASPFPIFLASLSDHTEVVDKTVAEMIMPLQEIGQKVLSAHFQSVIKKLGNGNTFVRKGLIDANKVASNVSGVHEVDSVDHDKPISHHIHQMAETPNTESAIDDVSAIEALARQALPTASGKVMTDLDRATRLQTATAKFENSRIMSHYAALLDDRGFSDMRQIMRDNELINRDTFDGGLEDSPEDPENPQRLEYSAEDMRSVKISVSNGLMNIDRFAVMSSLETIINFIIQSGNRDRFDLTKIINFYSDYAGIETDLNQFIMANPLDALDPEVQKILAQASQSGQLEQIIVALTQPQTQET